MNVWLSPRRNVLLVLVILAGSALLGLLLRPLLTSAATPDPVTAAWERARATGQYHFSSNIVQTTIPLATLANVGRTSRTDELYLEGQNDLHHAQMEFTLWSEGGSALQRGSGLSVRTAEGKTYARRGPGEWEIVDDFIGSVAPQGDFMSYLAAIKTVEAQPSETRGGIHFARYTFEIDSPRFAAYMHQQMEATLRARGELPPTLRLDVPIYFRDMVGSGELWVGEDGLPLRQILTLQFPPHEDEQVHSQIVVDFSRFGEGVTSSQPDMQGPVGALFDFSSVQPGNVGLIYALPLLALGMLLLLFRQKRWLNLTIVSVVIFAQIAGPVLSTMLNVRFIDAQTAQAAVQQERQAAAREDRAVRAQVGSVEFDPHLNLLEIVQSHESGVQSHESGVQSHESGLQSYESAAVDFGLQTTDYGLMESPQSLDLQSPVSSLQAAPAAQLVDDGTDSDGDTLSDFVEERIGTSYLNADTDSDGIPDNVEVAGFMFGGQRWYTDPGEADSNGDRLSDALEWGLNEDGSLRATPLDTDGDGIPDLFDMDNDGDGVPDHKDLSPFAKGTQRYNETSPLQLTVRNLTADTPTFVEFQLRPQDEKQLWFAYNVLDWPQDDAGQVRDIDGKTYADVAAANGRTASANEGNGDMKLLPMLEIRIPATSANLPPQADLTPFNITVNDFTADGQTKVAYVPLNIVTDEKTGQRVAFSGQMNYLPTGAWLESHQVRLAWVVQALVDLQCDPDNPEQVAQGCQADGYIHNVPQPIHSYYSEWNLTGLTVREDHGASMAIAYEDPAVDNDLQDDAALWSLSFVLDHHFALGRDENNDGQRDFTIEDIAPRFDRDNNPTAAQRMDVPNVLQVETEHYPTLEQAVAFTAMTETVKILNTVFKPVATADRAIKPLLLFAQESKLRALTFDSIAIGDYVVQNSGSLTFDLAPASKPAIMTSVTAGLKWMGYCAPAEGEVTFQPCTPDEYWDVLEGRYGHATPEAGETDSDAAIARLMMAQLYYMGFSSGYQGTVQAGNQVLSGTFAYENEAETATKVRASLQGIASAPVLAGLAFGRVYQAYLVTRAAGMVKGYSDFMKSLSTGIQLAQSAVTGTKGAALTKSLTNVARAQRALFSARVGPMATVGAILMVSLQIASMIPDLSPATRTVLGSLSLALNLGLTVIMPIAETAFFLKAGATSVMQALTQTFVITSALRIASLVGLAISALVIWGFFFYAMSTGELKAGDPALNRAFFEAVAATVVAVLLTILASNPIGLIIASIIGIIDLLLTLICEAGVDEMRDAPGLDGACFTLTGAVTKYLTRLLYSYDLMIDMGRSDLMVTDVPQTQLGDPLKGYVVGNTLNITLPVTTTVVHKDPDPNNGVLIYPYMYLFSAENLTRSTFKYSLTKSGNQTDDVALSQQMGEWQHVGKDHTYLVSPMYRGQLRSVPAPLTDMPLAAGLNATLPFTLNMSFAVPAYECWTLLVIPICYLREFKDANHLPIHALQYDVFPATLDEFLALGPKSNGGLGQSWDAKFPALRDADGDGLISPLFNGLDPNDATPDADGDGLTDRFELEYQMAGIPLSPISQDSDDDGLTDLQEILLGTNPAVADSDNDGLLDGEEVYHMRYDPDTSELTTIWEGGWDVTINAATPFVVRVSSDPLNADSDGDGVSDLAERQLAQDPNPANRVDNQNRPYHPLVPNTPPLALLLATDDLDGFLAPSQSLRYTNTVIANTAVAPGVLNVTRSSALGTPLNPLPVAFDPLTFTSAQTITIPVNLTVAPGSATQSVSLASTANTRLPNTGAPGWAFAPVTTEAPLGGINAPNVARLTDVTANRSDRQDSYLLSALANIDNSGAGWFGWGDILAYSLPGGQVRAIENDANNTAAFLGITTPSVATNANGDTLAAWGQLRYCNTVTFNSLKVVTAGADHVTGGIEPFISFQPDGGSEEQIWYWDSGGGTPDMTSGQQRGPNAFGFPITRTYCGGFGQIRVYESDGLVTDPAQNELVGMQVVDIFTPPPNGVLTFTGAGHTIELNVTVPVLDDYVIAGALLGPDGTIKRSITFPRSPVPTGYKAQSFGPTVTSDGSGFLVAYESSAQNTQGGLLDLPQVVVQAFDKDGNPLSQAYRDAGSTQASLGQRNSLALATTWIGYAYRVVWQDRRAAQVYIADVVTNGSSITAALPVFQNALTNAGVNYSPSVAYDPISGRVLTVFLSDARRVIGVLHAGGTPIGIPLVFNTAQIPAARSPQVTWHPGYQGWLVSYQDDAASQRHVFVPVDVDGDLAFPATTGFFVDTADNSLACPIPQSYPQVDLRFEELPGGTSFGDASGWGHHATCTGASCPATGVPGAPEALLSDYAVTFDGRDDFLTLNHSVPGDFTLAFWIKAPPAAVPDMILVDQGANQADGFTFWLSAGRPGLLINTAQSIIAADRIDDNQWHFVAATRNRSSGAVALYVDGNPTPVASNNFATGALNAVSDIRIGSDRAGNRDFTGSMDQLQIFPVALGGDTLQAIYNRSNQSYCVAAGASSLLNNVYWAKVQASQQDTRGGRLTASNGLTLTIDSDLPTATFTALPTNSVVGPGQVIGGSANDATSGVALVEVEINGSGTWQLANGANSWAFSLAGQNGALSLRVRATDNVGNVGNPSAAINLTVDSSAPTVTVTPIVGTVKPTRGAGGQWQVPLSGTASDAGGINPTSLLVHLTQHSGVGMAQTLQPATLTGNAWSINYLLTDGLFDPTGAYTVTVGAADVIGNEAPPVTSVVRLDARGPNAALSSNDAIRTHITQTLTISGVVSDTDSIAGIDTLEIAFTPVEQIAALPPGLTSDEAEALLNRVWTPVTLADRGAGVASTTWSYQIPAGLENVYQIDLRGTDMLGNGAISANVWRGHIDTLDPRLVMSAAATGVTYRDAASGELRYQMRFVCAAQDRNLAEASFSCPGQGLAEPVRSFDDTSALANLFPDLALRTGLAISYTLWSTTPTLEATVSACDSFGRCASLSNTATAGTVSPSSAPSAVVVAPSDGAYVAASDAEIPVTVAAEAAAMLQTIRLRLDGNQVGEVTFAQTAAVDIVQQTFSIPHPAVGAHTLVAEATDWSGATQTTLFPVEFTFDGAPPQVAIATVEVSAADTWMLGSGILQFTGTASDDVGLAAVQVRVDNGPWADAAFANGAWHIAYPVPDPEGQTLSVLVRASDLAGQIGEATKSVPVNFSVPIPPDTTLIDTPSNPSTGPSATFIFTGTAGTNGLAIFECRLNAGLYQPCNTPWTLTELSQGAQTFAVRAIDSQGYVDPTPATYSWVVTAGPLAVAITQAPSNPTSERTVSFSFVAGGVTGYECKLSQATFGAEASFAPCTTGISYTGLVDGEYTFEVRGRNGEQVGQATRHTWQVVNEAPVAHDQQLTTLQPEPIALTLSAQDGDPLTFYIIQRPRHGVLLGTAPDLVYVPDTDFFGSDSFTFQADDGATRSNLATITIQVAERGIVIDQCGVYTVYQRGDSSYAAYARIQGALIAWSGTILVGTAAQNNLVGTAGNDLILGLGGNDILNGKAGDDVICGGEGNDLIYGELGTDYLDGGNHNDVLNGGTGDYDVLLGGEGNDTLLDPDGVAALQGGPGNDQINLSLRNGWRTPAPESATEFIQRFAAGLGNDTVTFGILGSDTFLVDITGDEWADMAGEGTADTIRFAGRIDQANSHFRKFEGQVIIATSELPLITDETGFEFWEDVPVAEGPEPAEPGEEEPAPPSSETLQHQLYLPVIGK